MTHVDDRFEALSNNIKIRNDLNKKTEKACFLSAENQTLRPKSWFKYN